MSHDRIESLREATTLTIQLDRDLCFIDCETLGLHPDAPVWEVAAVRLDRETGQPATAFAMLVEHDRYRADGTDWVDDLPEKMRGDYIARYWSEFAASRRDAATEIARITDGAIIAGSNPGFDMERLGKLLHANGITPTWHYHPLDIPSMALGNLTMQALLIPGDEPKVGRWHSEALSRGVEVEPAAFERHTAMGDVQWCLAQWRAMTEEKAW